MTINIKNQTHLGGAFDLSVDITSHDYNNRPCKHMLQAKISNIVLYVSAFICFCFILLFFILTFKFCNNNR